MEMPGFMLEAVTHRGVRMAECNLDACLADGCILRLEQVGATEDVPVTLIFARLNVVYERDLDVGVDRIVVDLEVFGVPRVRPRCVIPEAECIVDLRFVVATVDNIDTDRH